MGLSESSKKLIEEWRMAVESERNFAFEYYSAPAWLVVRDEIAKRGLDKEKEAIEIDKKAIKKAIKVQAEAPMGRDDEAPPLTHWWWYLDLIAQGKYPIELLPEELKEIYLSSFHYIDSYYRQ